MKKLALCLMCLFCVYGFSQDIELQTYATGLINPVNIKHAGDDRLFVAERAGFIRIVNTSGTVNTAPFLDIDARVINNGGEQGLLAIAFHPQYVSNGFFYVNYIDNSGNTVISRFTRSTLNSADPSSELILMTIIQPFSNHNGGDMHFGSDNNLYISTGDGGSAGDPGDRAQDLTDHLGKMLRIDVNNPGGGNNYGIPGDNPYFNSPDGPNDPRPEIWAYGLRNPWKFSFDRDTNDLWIADVGQNQIEEINMVRISDININYGWRCYEGNSEYNTTDCPNPASLTFPVEEYNHSDGDFFKCSITGGYRYRGALQTNLYGLYFFADYCSDEIGYVEESGSAYSLTFLDRQPGNGWSAFGEDIDGELYIAGLNSGTIFRIIDATLSIEEFQQNTIKMYPNPAKDLVSFDFSSLNSKVSDLIIYSITGNRIKTYTNIGNDGIEISLKGVSKGLYLVKIKTLDGLEQTSKLVIN